MAVDYKFYDIKFVKQNQKKLIKDAMKAHDRFHFAYGQFLKQINSTSFFRYYSFVSLSAGSSVYYLLFKEIQKNIRKFYKKKGPLWFQCWLNLHANYIHHYFLLYKYCDISNLYLQMDVI